MAQLSTFDKQILEKLFRMGGGYVLDFSDRTFAEFFNDDLGINIYSQQYDYGSGSKANRLKKFWSIGSDEVVAKSISKMTEYIENKIMIGDHLHKDYPFDLINAAKKIVHKLLKGGLSLEENKSQASFINGNINIQLQKEIFDHVQKLIQDGYYFNAVEESYKIVRKKLRDVSGYERATDAFKPDNIENLFGHKAKDTIESDFFDGIKYLHMAIQFLRNEKAHTPAEQLDPNIAIHYISLASLAYDLIDRNN